MGASSLADDLTLDHVDRFRIELTSQRVAVNQIREIIKVVKVVHN